MALPVGFYGSLQWIGWLSLLDEVALNHWNTHFLLKTLFTRYLRNNGIGDDHIIYLALDDISNNRLLNPMELDSYIRCLIKDNSTYYVILDEIQRVFTIVNPILTEGKILLTTNEVISAVRNAWSKYQNMTDAYC